MPATRTDSTDPLRHAGSTYPVAEWNDTVAAYPRDRCLPQLIEAQAVRTPRSIAAVFGEHQVTYRELNERANRLAHHLRALGVAPDERVAVCLNRGIDMLVAMLAAMKAGGAYLPLDPDYPAERLAFMLDDAEVRIVLTETAAGGALPRTPGSSDSQPGKDGSTALRLVRLDADADVIASQPATDPSPLATPQHLAYVIYTSGSTGRPKGVMIEHRGLVNNIHWQIREFGFNARDRFLQWTTIVFDASIWELWTPLCVGATQVIADAQQASDPRATLRLIQDEAITFAQAVPSFFSALLTEIEHGQPPASLRLFAVGGEALNRRDAARWTAACGAELVNMYGPTECTVDATFHRCRAGEADTVPIGRPIANTRIYIVDERMQPVPVGVTGELYIASDGIARGYLNRPELTAERFVPDPFGSQPGARLYRTGDLGRFLPDGNIEFLGRIDHQVKIRGYRIELDEIEAALHDCPGVERAAVTVTDDEPARLVGYVVPASLQPADLREALKARLPAYMIPSAMVALAALPTLPNGKLDRKALPAPDWSAQRAADHAPAQGSCEQALAGIWGDILGIDRIGRHDDFFELGGHSLLATQAVSRIRSEFDIDLPLRALFDRPTVAGLAEVISVGSHSPAGAGAGPILPRHVSEPAPLSAGQSALWFIDRLEGPSSLYNVVDVLRLEGELDVPALQRALQRLLDRHDVLRACVAEDGGTPVLSVKPDLALPFELIDLEREADAGDGATPQSILARALAEGSSWRFDLAEAPLLRARLLRLSGREHVLQIVMHHIVSDGWSLDVLMRELERVYRPGKAGKQGAGTTLPALPLCFADYAAWQQARLQDGSLDEDLRWWCDRLSGLQPLDLPTDRPRAARASHRGAHHQFAIPDELAAQLGTLARRHGATLFMVLLGAFQTLLMRCCGQTDIAVGSPTAGRQRPELEPLVGYFVNMLVLRTDLSGDPTFTELLARVRQTALDAYAHQALPFDRLVAEMRPQRQGAGDNPLFDVCFSLQDWADPPLQLPGIAATRLPTPRETSQFDLTLEVVVSKGSLAGTLEYRSDLFDAATVARIGRQYVRLLEAIAADAERSLRSLPLLDEAERKQLLVQWNDTAAQYPRDRCLPQLIEAQVARTPQAVAAIFGERQVSYRELNERANRLAHHLRALGVVPDARVAVCMQRGIDMLVAMLAVMKAGGAYLPLDPDYPAERLAFMLDDADVRIVLTEAAAGDALAAVFALPDAKPDGIPPEALRLIRLDADADLIASQPATDPSPLATPQHLAYVIYTSGSTGRPKGVMIEHRGLVNNIHWQIREFGFNARDRFLQWTTIVFDASIWELWTPLCVGATQVIVHAEQARDPRATLQLIRRESITFAQTVPSFFSALLTEIEHGQPPTSLRLFAVGGEALDRKDAARWSDACSAELVNMYGPTECTVDATFHRYRPGDSTTVTIGRPIANTRIYIVDERMQPVPVGVAGELYIASDGIARGYLNRPELTAERFVPDPFGSQPGARLYRTGDLGRFLADGNIEFLGRTDHQVKIRGYRIELDEIEAALRDCPGVNQAAVTVSEGEPARLVGYVAPAALQPAALRDALDERLPAYMVPSAIVTLAALPTLPNGKLDRKALPPPDWSSQAGSDYEAPQGPGEQGLATIWRQVLGIERIGRHDDFFELGGHSLLVVSMVQAARHQGLDTSVREVFDLPRLSSLARAISARSGGAGPGSRPVQAATVAPNRIPPGCTAITPALLPLIDLTQQDIDRIVATVPGGAANVQDIYPLAPLQEGILYHHHLETEGDTYLLRDILAFDSQAHLTAFLEALQIVIDRHDSLRTAVLWENLPQSLQVVYREAALPIHHLACAASASPLELLKAATDPGRLRLDLTQAPLMAAYVAQAPGEETCYLGLVDHHIIGDHVTLDRMMEEVRAVMTGRMTLLQEPVPYREFVARARETSTAEHEAYFRDLLGDVDEPTLPFDLADVRADHQRIEEAHRLVSDDLAARIHATAARLGVSAAVLFHVACAMVLARCSGRDDVVFGTVLLGRSQGFPGVERVMGLCMNTLPVRLRLDAIGARDAVTQMFRQLGALLGHEQAPLALAQRCSSIAAPAPLFSALLNYRHSDAESVATDGTDTFSGFNGVRSIFGEERTNYPFNVFIDDLGGGFRLVAQCVDGIDPQRILGYLDTAADGLVRALDTAPQTPIGSLEILPADETQRLLGAWNDSAADYPQERCLHHLVEAQARRRPAITALVCGTQAMSYGELDQRANRLACLLRARGAGRGRQVGLCIDRGIDMVVAQLAVLKAGAAYVPLDPAYPKDRLEFMATDARLAVLVTKASMADILPWPRERTVMLDADAALIARQPAEDSNAVGGAPRASDTAYIIYTSGSTGRPKGVMVPHRAAVNFLWSMAREPGLRETDRLLAVTTLSFDIALLELMLPLSVGACVVIASREEAADGAALRALLHSSAATIMQATPATWRLLLEAGWEGSASLTGLIGGEALAADLAEQLLQRTGELWNMYGPTETTVWSTCWRVQRPELGISIGRPIANTTIHILDGSGRLCPTGVAGEIHIGGDGVAQGYLGRPELTAERFLPDPLSRHGSSGKLYRTGDRGRWRHDGTLEHLGRLDAQVKVRGYRIELGEIEACLALHADVTQCAVVTREDRAGDVRIVAYVVPRIGLMPPAAELRMHLRESLPEYMVPQHFVEMARMPLLPNGKLDRKSLPQPEAGSSPTGHLPPRNGTEAALADIWADVLGVDRVGVDDSFFELGGHSLLALRLMQRIEQRFNRVFRLATLFDAPTIAGLAALLDSEAGVQAATCAVTITAGGSRPPLFFISGWGGAIIGFKALAAQMHPDQPLYVLDTTAFGTPTHPVGSLVQVAARMIEDMRRIQPEGPYQLCGFSQGGKIVYEIAQQLHRAGENVGLLAMLDCTAPGYPRKRPVLQRIALHLRQMMRQGPRENLEHLTSRLRYLYRVATNKDSDLFADDADIGTSSAAQAIQAVADAMTEAWEAYTPAFYPGEILLITANIRDFRPSEIDDDPFLGWGNLIGGGIEVRGMDAHHVRMIDPPHAPELASILADYLQKPAASESAEVGSADRAAGRIRPAKSEDAVTIAP